MERLRVALGQRTSTIVVDPGLLDRAGAHLAPYAPAGRLIVVTDRNVAAAQLPRLVASAAAHGIAIDPVVLPPGEATKDWATLQFLCDELSRLGVRRDDAVVALGGGVVGDVAGLAAALHLRGCPLVQIPTSLVAQVDSSVGGKVAIDTPHGKNAVGCFHQPALVLVDPTTLATLPDRDFRAGYAELVKVALIEDADFFAWCETHAAAVLAREPAALAAAIPRCIAAKARRVEADERDTGGVRALLNLGHSFAHAFETLARYDGRLIHGEAVAAGMAIAFSYSADIGLCSAGDAARVAAHLRGVGLPDTVPSAIAANDPAAIVDVMRGDKKNAHDGLTLVLAHGIGRAVLERGVDPADVVRFLSARV